MSPSDYAKILYETVDGKSEIEQDKILRNFKNILIRNKEIHLASAIEKEFAKIQKQEEQEKITYISSPSELTASQKMELKKISSEPREFSVNPGLLGGIAVRIKDKIYNATLRKKIESLKSSL